MRSWQGILLFLSLTLGAIAADNGLVTGKIRGDKLGNWWTVGQNVKFNSAGPLVAGTTAVLGEIFDSNGVKVGEKQITATDFMTAGWTWKPLQPGFYEVCFSFIDATGKKTPAMENIPCKIYKWVGGKPELVIDHNFVRQKHNVAVLATPDRTPEEMPPQLAISLGPAHERKAFRQEWSDKNIQLAAMVGFHTIRIHTISWYFLEEAQGKYNWDVLDNFLREARKNGFKDFVGNPYGTPKWASPHPEQVNLNICVWEYTAYAPTKMQYWNDFLRTLVKRYPEIKKWELWNEPHLPGQSVFWNDSPANYVELLKNGYQTIKEVQPDSSIWLGGIALRYQPFYSEIMKLGAGKYFDRLALHGSWPSPQPFQQINQQNGVEAKPWVSSEWHGMLASNGEPVTPTEDLLSHNMLLDFMNQLRMGAETIAFFTTTNIPHGREHEMMDFFRKNNQMLQTFGLFRSEPYVEPRLMAVVWRNFSDCFAGNMKYLDGFYFDGGKQSAALMTSDRGKVAIFWQNSETPVKIAAALKAAIGKKSVVTDWEGRNVTVDDKFMLRNNVIYFLKNPDENAIALWRDRGQILRPNQKEPVLDRTVKGRYVSGALFDSAMASLPVEPVWLPVARYISKNEKVAAPGFSARFATAFGDHGLDLLVEVKDQSHHQTAKNGDMWMGDGVQFAIDGVGKGLAEDRIEFSAGLTSDGAVLWKETMPSLGGDLPGRITMPKNAVKYGKAQITHSNGMTVYKIHIDRDDLYPFSYMPGQPVRFSLLVNDNNGKERAGYLEWSSGIGNTKDPANYGTLTVNTGKKTVYTQADLRGFWGAVKLERGADSVKAISDAKAKKNAAAVSCSDVDIIGGGAYKITFKARGNVGLNGMFILNRPGQKGERMDFMARGGLSDEWKSFEFSPVIPLGVKKLNLSLFCWEQDGWFEVKDFQMISE